MRDYEFLPYEKAIEAMAREYAKVRPLNPLKELTDSSKNEPDYVPPFDSFLVLENTYCKNLEMLMYIRQLRVRVNKSDLREQLDKLFELKTEIADRLEKVYHAQSGKYPASPAVSKVIIPVLLRKLLLNETIIINNTKTLEKEYNQLKGIEQDEIKASLILDNIIIIITSL